MNTISVEARCKICKGPVVAKTSEDCPQSWIDKLLPMITCNRCYDLNARRGKIEQDLYAAADALMSGVKDPIRDKVIGKLRMSVRSYASYLADVHRQPEYHFSEDVVDMLIERPEKCSLILRGYRDTVRNIYATPKDLIPA